MDMKASHYPPGINTYVPKMQYAADVVIHGDCEYSLGTPEAADTDGIIDALLANAEDVRYVADGPIGFETDMPYGRTINAASSGATGANTVITLIGEDFLGQPVQEALTITTAQTTTPTEGKKAFKRLWSVASDGGGSNAETVEVGWANKFGLPYKFKQFLGGSENGRLTAPSGVLTPVTTNLAGMANAVEVSFTAPFDGYLIGAKARITTAVTSAASVMDAVVGGSGVAALDFTIPVAAAGISVVHTLSKTDWVWVERGTVFSWTSDGAPDAGAADITPLFSHGLPDFIEPDVTDPATAVTGDPRGLYLPQVTPNGSVEYVLRYIPSLAFNADGNGGLHGIRHFGG